jgi:hypothetical protein
VSPHDRWTRERTSSHRFLLGGSWSRGAWRDGALRGRFPDGLHERRSGLRSCSSIPLPLGGCVSAWPGRESVSVDGKCSLHSSLGMAGHGALERVRPGCWVPIPAACCHMSSLSFPWTRCSDPNALRRLSVRLREPAIRLSPSVACAHAPRPESATPASREDGWGFPYRNGRASRGGFNRHASLARSGSRCRTETIQKAQQQVRELPPLRPGRSVTGWSKSTQRCGGSRRWWRVGHRRRNCSRAVTEEVGRLLAVDSTYMGRCESDGTLAFVASWGGPGNPFRAGHRGELGWNSLVTTVQKTARSAFPARRHFQPQPDAARPAARTELGEDAGSRRSRDVRVSRWSGSCAARL